MTRPTPVGFVRDGMLVLRERVEGIEVGWAIRAARALREAVTRLELDRLIVPAWRLVDSLGHRLVRPAPEQEPSVRAKLDQRLGQSISPPEPQRDHEPER